MLQICFYGKQSAFIDSSHPWVYRGGSWNFGVIVGEYAMGRDTGCVHNAYGSWLVKETIIE